MVRIRMKTWVMKKYQTTGAKPSYFPHRGGAMDLLFDGIEVWAEESRENEDNLILRDNVLYRYDGKSVRLVHYIVSRSDFNIIDELDNRKVQQYA